MTQVKRWMKPSPDMNGENREELALPDMENLMEMEITVDTLVCENSR